MYIYIFTAELVLRSKSFCVLCTHVLLYNMFATHDTKHQHWLTRTGLSIRCRQCSTYLFLIWVCCDFFLYSPYALFACSRIFGNQPFDVTLAGRIAWAGVCILCERITGRFACVCMCVWSECVQWWDSSEIRKDISLVDFMILYVRKIDIRSE